MDSTDLNVSIMCVCVVIFIQNIQNEKHKVSNIVEDSRF